MNLVQQANFLEDVPKEQLAQMSQDPNAQFPPFLVLSEIQRRTINEKNYQAMQQQPTTTVAEEVVNEFMQPQLAQKPTYRFAGWCTTVGNSLARRKYLCRIIWCTNCSYANGS
jgi:hypothetical protein